MLTMMKDVSTIGGQNHLGEVRKAPREEIREISTIFGRPYIVGSSRHTQDRYAIEARIGLTIVVNRMEE